MAPRIFRRLLHLLRQREMDTDLAEELGFHQAMKQTELERSGLPANEAEFASRRALGNATRAREDARAVWVWRWLDDLWRDLSYATRSLKKNRSFTAVAVLTLALGIGANTAIFSLVDALLLRWLPVRDPQELVQLRMLNPQRPPSDNFSYPEIGALGDQKEIFSGLAAYGAATTFNVGPAEAFERTLGARVNGAFYETLRLQPVVGRLIAPYDDRPSAEPVVVITDAYWQRKFGRDPKAVGQTILIDGVPVTIVGVSPPGFVGATVGEVVDLTLPAGIVPQVSPGNTFLIESGSSHRMRVIGRPRPDIGPSQIKARVAAVWPQVARLVTPQGSNAVVSVDDRCRAGRNRDERPAAAVPSAVTGPDGRCRPLTVDCLRQRRQSPVSARERTADRNRRTAGDRSRPWADHSATADGRRALVSAGGLSQPSCLPASAGAFSSQSCRADTPTASLWISLQTGAFWVSRWPSRSARASSSA